LFLNIKEDRMDKSKSNNPSPLGRGNPSDTGKYKAAVKNVENIDELERDEEIEEKFLDDKGNPSPDALKHSNRNRNYNKPGLDNNNYN
jgi:hypothetical protein